MSARPIRATSVVYHRNGIGGEGFFLVSFLDGDRPLLAVVFTDEHHPEDVSRVAVFDPATSVGDGRPEQTYGGGGIERLRGADCYGPALLAAIRERTAAWETWYEAETEAAKR